MLKIVESTEQSRGSASAGMLEVLLGRGNGVKLVQVHGFRIVKVTPVKGAENPCCDFVRGGARFSPMDNTKKLSELFQSAFGEYLVTVCSGVVKEVARVAKEEQVREKDLVEAPVEQVIEEPVEEDEVMSAETIAPKPFQRRNKVK